MQDVINPRRRADGNGSAHRLSYRFQRLREQIRGLVLAGEFGSRLPGERILARRFQANAKTVNKALSDLCGEGLLVRFVGRGTFVAEDHQAASTRRPLKLAYFTGRACATATNSPRILMSLLEAETKKGGTLEAYPAGGDQGAAEVRLEDWPSATRSQTHGLFCIPNAPLSSSEGYFGESLVIEAYRRHVPVVALGACAVSPKLNAVLPDYVDAGFRLAEHLLRLGCTSLVAVCRRRGRESEAVICGCRTAVRRMGARLETCELKHGGDASDNVSLVVATWGKFLSEDEEPNRTVAGTVCIGAEALRIVESCRRELEQRHGHPLPVASVLDVGDPSAADLGITSYEVDPERIASWGVRLIREARPGWRPVEIIIPGSLRVRGSRRGGIVSEGAAAADFRTPADGANADIMAEAAQ